MKARRNISWLVGLVLALLGATAMATSPHVGPYRLDARMNPHPTSAGPAKLSLGVTPLIDCSEVTLSITRLDNIAIIGPSEITQKASKDSLSTLEIQIDIPENDTSGFVLRLQLGSVDDYGEYYWVAREDTVEFHKQNPRMSDEAILRGRKLHIISGADTALDRANAEAAKYYPNGRVRSGRFDDSGRWVDEEDDQAMQPEPQANLLPDDFVPGDPSIILTREGDRWVTTSREELELRQVERTRQAALDSMRVLEQYPLEDTDTEILALDGKLWARHRGETEFRAMELLDDRLARRALRKDSLRAADTTVEYDCVLDLRRQDHFRYADSVLDDMKPEDSAGFYRARVVRRLYKLLRKAGIPAQRINPPSSSDEQSSEKPRTRPNRKPSATAINLSPDTDVLFSEDFEDLENPFPSNR